MSETSIPSAPQRRGFDRTVRRFLAIGVPVCFALAAIGTFVDGGGFLVVLISFGLLVIAFPATQAKKARDNVDVFLLSTLALIGFVMLVVAFSMFVEAMR